MTIDVTKPSDDDNIDSIAGYIRETREEIASAEVVTVSDIEVNLISPVPTMSNGINVVNLSAQYAISVSSLSIPTDGTIAILRFEDNNVTLVDGTGNLNLNGDPNAPDFPAQAGDIIFLVYQDTRWNEIIRNLS